MRKSFQTRAIITLNTPTQGACNMEKSAITAESECDDDQCAMNVVLFFIYNYV